MTRFSELIRKYDEGVDFENVSQVIDAVERIYNTLEIDDSVRSQDILIDITGGQKIPGVAGAAAALAAGRRFQYISTADMRVCTFNLTYIGEN